MEKKITISVKKQVMCLFVAVLSVGFSVLNAQVSLAGTWLTGAVHAKEAGANRVLVVMLYGELGASSPMSATTVTFGGVEMTKVTEVNFSHNGTNFSYTSTYVLKEAGIVAATTGDIAVTWATAPGTPLIVSAFFNNVNQTTPVGAFVSNTGSGAAISAADLANSAGDMVIIGATAAGSGLFTFDTSYTLGYEEVNASGIGGITAIYKLATGTAVTPSLNNNNSGQLRLTMIGLVLKKGTATSNNDLRAQQLISVSPNPVLDVMNINLPNAENRKEVNIYSSIGKLLYSTSTTNSAISIDVNSLNYKGLVLVQVVAGKQTEFLKVLVK